MGRRRSGRGHCVKLSKLLIHIASSLWFVPVICVLAGALLSFVTIALDRHLDFKALPSSLVGDERVGGF